MLIVQLMTWLAEIRTFSAPPVYCFHTFTPVMTLVFFSRCLLPSLDSVFSHLSLSPFLPAFLPSFNHSCGIPLCHPECGYVTHGTVRRSLWASRRLHLHQQLKKQLFSPSSTQKDVILISVSTLRLQQYSTPQQDT